MQPIYNPNLSYSENFEDGPFFTDQIPAREFPPESEWIDFLGHKIASRIGVPAGPLLNSKWIKLAGKLGFDVVTYKTIRTQKYASHPLPNITFVDANLNLQNLDTSLIAQSTETAGITNSFGMPSQPPEYLREDIKKAKESLAPGQLLIVSAVGTPRPNEDFTQDFVEAVTMAKEYGAEVVEANFSCPNVCTGEGSLYTNPETVKDLGGKLVEALGNTPLILKIGFFRDPAIMREVFIAAAKAGVKGISGLNSVAMKVVDENNEPALGPDRLTSGVCGSPIRELALQFVRDARKIINEEKLDLALVGVGGVTEPEHFQDLLDAGANLAMSATGMMWDPLLAQKFHSSK